MHLIVDGYQGDKEKMSDMAFIYKLLDTYPERIGMNKIMPPYVFEYRGIKPQDWGVSGFVLIAESHISIHTFPDRAYVNIDIFSCKEFDAEAAVNHLSNEFNLSSSKTYILPRGLEYPHDTELAKGLTEKERIAIMPTRSGDIYE